MTFLIIKFLHKVEISIIFCSSLYTFKGKNYQLWRQRALILFKTKHVIHKE